MRVWAWLWVCACVRGGGCRLSSECGVWWNREKDINDEEREETKGFKIGGICGPLYSERLRRVNCFEMRGGGAKRRKRDGRGGGRGGGGEI